MEVQGEEVGAGDEDEAVDEANREGSEVGSFGEEAERHHGVFGEFPFVEEEEGYGDDAEDEEADYSGGGPGVLDAAVFEAEEKHDGAACDGDDADPVDGFQAGEDGRLGRFDVEEEEDDEEGESVEGEVDVETPAPGDFFGEDAAEDGADGAGESPDAADHAKVFSSVSVSRLEWRVPF